MDYNDVPQEVLDLSVKVSKAANAEYWACDVAVGVDGKYRILECATAFAAFPYIRDWIGQYLMWKFSDGQFKKPYIPLYNWEEICKINSNVLRTMRYITFGKEVFPSCDSGELFTELSDDNYPIVDTTSPSQEEWPSETWNRQDNYKAKQKQINANKAVEIAQKKSYQSDGTLTITTEASSDETQESPEAKVIIETLPTIIYTADLCGADVILNLVDFRNS